MLTWWLLNREIKEYPTNTQPPQEKTGENPPTSLLLQHICLQDQIGFQPLPMPMSASFFKLWAPPPLQSMPRPVNFRNKTVLWKNLLFYYFFACCDEISLPICTVSHKQVEVRWCPAPVPLLSAFSTFWTSRYVWNINQCINQSITLQRVMQ